MSFELHPRLAADCFVVGRFELSLLLLMNDARYPWFILVPQRAGISEIHQLSGALRQLLMSESAALSEALAVGFDADKINIAALGNIVSQLHVHHIARYTSDPAWPAPVWGTFPAIHYTDGAQLDVIRRLSSHLPAESLSG
ncbi:MAG: HIT domain-containing protein, partial [Mariprofundaceae bacterium]|nr:HIT domain-containing protein [Mariprofundaceae bacterium]